MLDAVHRPDTSGQPRTLAPEMRVWCARGHTTSSQAPKPQTWTIGRAPDVSLYLRSLRPVQLRLIATIAQQGKLRLAADLCGMTTPAASRMLAEMETQLTTTLFERRPKGMVPTPSGEVLVRHASKLMHDVDQMATEFDAHLAGQGGAVRVGAVTGGALAIVIPAILDMKQEAPLVDVSLDVSSTAQLMHGLERGDFDFVLSRVGSDDYSRGFDILPAQTESVLLMVRNSHPLAGSGPVALADLRDAMWTMQDRGAPIRHALEIAFHDEGIDLPRNLIKSASVVAIMALLRKLRRDCGHHPRGGRPAAVTALRGRSRPA